MIAFVDIAAAHQRNPHGLKVVRADRLVVEAHVSVGAGAYPSIATFANTIPLSVSGSRRQCGGLHAWQRPDALDQASIELTSAVRVVAAQERIE